MYAFQRRTLNSDPRGAPAGRGAAPAAPAGRCASAARRARRAGQVDRFQTAHLRDQFFCPQNETARGPLVAVRLLQRVLRVWH